MFGLFKKNSGSDMDSLPRKNSEFLAMYRKDIEEIIKPYGFFYEDRDEYYGSQFQSSEVAKTFRDLYYKEMPYGKLYMNITSSGRLSEYEVEAYLEPAINEIAHIEETIYGEDGIRDTDNKMRWKEGGEGIRIDLAPTSRLLRDISQYDNKLALIRINLSQYVNTDIVPELLEQYLKNRSNIFPKQILESVRSYRLGYWLMLLKIGNEKLYQELNNQYVELNQTTIKQVWGQDITKLKEFLDTYTVGSLA